MQWFQSNSQPAIFGFLLKASFSSLKFIVHDGVLDGDRKERGEKIEVYFRITASHFTL